MKQTEKDLQILQQLHEVAHDYFVRIVEANTIDGECKLSPGIYTASQLANHAKNPMCDYYRCPMLTEDESVVTITVGTFQMRFKRWDIFVVLAKWEKILKIGKLAAKFNVGQAEEKRVVVIVVNGDEVTEKRITLQRYVDDWWIDKKQFDIYFHYNGKFLKAGGRVDPCQMRAGKYRQDREKHLRDFTPKAIPTFRKWADIHPVWAKACEMAGIETDQEEERRNNEIVAFVDCLLAQFTAAADIAKAIIRQEIEKTIARLKQLADAAGVDLNELLKDKCDIRVCESNNPDSGQTAISTSKQATEAISSAPEAKLPVLTNRRSRISRNANCAVISVVHAMPGDEPVTTLMPEGRSPDLQSLPNPPPLIRRFLGSNT